MNDLWFDPTFGASGDMILGAFLALGVDEQLLNDHLGRLGIDGLEVRASPELRNELSATRAEIRMPDEDHHVHRAWSQIDQLIATANLPDGVEFGARHTFRRLGETEASIHGTTIDEVHFHEVGGLDAIADIVGSWIAWHLLGEPNVAVGTFGLGSGTVMASHGRLPLPAPAVVELLKGWSTRPLHGAEMETVTPTGAALLTSMAAEQGPHPAAGVITGVGRGCGGRDPDSHPNVLTAITVDTGERKFVPTPMVELVTNVDDVTPEVLAWVVERCLAEGAADAWIAPIVMKKGRPAHTVNVLCSADVAESLRTIVMAETGSLGIRQRTVERFAVERTFETVVVQGQEIRIKIGPHRAKPELANCLRAAHILRMPLHEVQRRAMEEFGRPTED